MKGRTMRFVFSSRVLHVIMASFSTPEEEHSEVLERLWPQHSSRSREYIPTPPFFFFLTSKAQFSHCEILRDTSPASSWVETFSLLSFQIMTLRYPRLGITLPSTIFWGQYSANTTVSCCCCLSFFFSLIKCHQTFTWQKPMVWNHSIKFHQQELLSVFVNNHY